MNQPSLVSTSTRGPSAYTLTELLHEGTTTVLHRGYRTADRAPVVVKTLKSEYPTRAELARLRHEYLITKDIDAPGVVRAYGLEKIGDSLSLALEDFDGRPLDAILRAERLDLEAALRIGIALAAALEALHDRRIIHKDIKPHNILVNWGTGQVKLTDFGIASRLSQETHKAARPEALEGTLAYMSPEQTGRMNRVVDARSDLYSLGVTLYEMLTGALPFMTTDPMAVVHSHIARLPQPPHERAPALPEVVSDIVMKLLAKAAEDRYQSAAGLKADLEQCLSRLSQSGHVAPFALGQRDAPLELLAPQKLYGRENEVATLLDAFARASAGSTELLLVVGQAGVGKSALVGELHPAIGRHGAYFIAGKFDQRSHTIPYTAVAAALRELLRQLLAEPAEALARWRDKLLSAVGKNGQILIDLIPELSLLIGPQPPVPALGPVEAQNRFGLVFQDFLGVFAAREHPLVVFLDDLQWADPASLKLLALLLASAHSGHLLILGAYRPEEVEGGHPLARALGELHKSAARVSELKLDAIKLGDVERLVTDTLGGDLAEVAALARLVFDKTHGNPFFMGQLLTALHAEGQIRFDRGAGAYRWELARIKEAKVTDNVVLFMAAKIDKLSPEARHMLTLAACIGHRFDLTTLSLIAERPRADVARGLWEALREGLVLPLDTEYRFLPGPDPALFEAPSPEVFDVAYRFLHDRVQQAAYAAIAEGSKREAHLRIGRLMLREGDPRAHEARLFEVVDHLNLGAALIHDRDERLSLARLNLAAGERAKAATAYQAAEGYFEAGAALLDEASWQDEYALWFALHAQRGECTYLVGRFDQASALLDRLLGRARSTVDKAQLYALISELSTMRGDHQGAVNAGQKALALFGVMVPETEERRKAALGAELAEVGVNLAGRRIEELVDAPLLTDPAVRAQLSVLVKMALSAYLFDLPLYTLLVVMMANLGLKNGNVNTSAYVFASYALLLQGAFEQYEAAVQFRQLAIALSERFESPEYRCKTYAMIGVWGPEHRLVQKSYMDRAWRAGAETGDFSVMPVAAHLGALMAISAGQDLGVLRGEIEERRSLLRRIKEPDSLAITLLCLQTIKCLGGQTRGRASLSDDGVDEAALVTSLEAPGFTWAKCVYHTLKLELLFLAGEYEGALAAATVAEATAASGMGTPFVTDIPFYAGLTLAALYASASAADKERYAARLADHETKHAVLVARSPDNHRHKHLLLRAEAARIGARHAEAWELYDAAIAAAREQQFTHHEAIASELAARFYLGRGNVRVARLYLRGAYHAYLRWGASEKASALADQYPDLLRRKASAGADDGGVLSTTTTSGGTARFDAAAMIRAAHAIAGEIALDKLIDQLMRIVVQNAGADRGVLLLMREDQLMIEASMTLSPELVQVGPPCPLSADAQLSLSVVQFVERTREPVVLGDACSKSLFSADPYLVARAPRSLLCLAMTQKGRLTGILYLENHAARDAFTEARVEIAGLLAAQAAIAVDNALLVSGIQHRTEELGRANDALRAAKDRLERELFEREQAEAARAALKEELVRVQTPLIPIFDGIMVMPLIGSVDAERAQQVLETALRGVQANRARLVIIDVTGVERVDAEVTRSLVRTAGAIGLLGAQAVITGIRPEVAQVLVALQLDLRAIVTRGTLQSGIAYAMERLGQGPMGKWAAG